MNVLAFIMEKIREKPDVTKPVAIESNMAEREKQVDTVFLKIYVAILYLPCVVATVRTVRLY